MNVFLRQCAAVLLLGALVAAPVAAAGPESLTLLGRSTVEDYSVSLSEPDWNWLRHKRTLVLGASAPDYSPFGITGNGDEYEGMTADYAHLLEQLLHVRVDVRRYESRAEVIAALKRGEVDLLGTANGFEAGDPELALSEDYANDQPVLVTRIDDSQNLPADLAGKRVAMLYHYLPPDTVKAFTRRPRCSFSVDAQRDWRRCLRPGGCLPGRLDQLQLPDQQKLPEQCAAQ